MVLGVAHLDTVVSYDIREALEITPANPTANCILRHNVNDSVTMISDLDPQTDSSSSRAKRKPNSWGVHDVAAGLAWYYRRLSY